MSYTFRPAQRAGTKPIIGLYGLSGSGKTYSSLLLARGFAGEQGRVGMIDTESGRGELYSDVIPGGYDVLRLDKPFSPERYMEALDAAEAAKLDALVIDSMSHEWEGVGGVLDMAAAIEARSGKPGLHCWQAPKMAHQKLVLRLLQSPLFIICSLRAKHKSRQVKNEKGRQEIVKDDHPTPMQAEDFIFEMTVHAEVQPDHALRVTKCSHPDLAGVFRDGQKITLDTGRALAEWAQGGALDDAAREKLLEEARDKASDGDTAFRAWMAGRSAIEKTAIKTIGKELRQRISAAEERTRPREDDWMAREEEPAHA
jgi:hypothetical protein